MLNRYDPGDKVSATDAAVLAEALKLHPEADEKIGPGIKDFSVRSAEFGSKCFWVNRTDGTTAKFSHTACV
ncbi:DCL family protein [Bradyrhizobium sp. Pha-3]|uniref:DCL family protein n=1 Tax=Bradyrhizobium sp. Pha-3 TaxID=208375 RepID=UPI0035D47183